MKFLEGGQERDQQRDNCFAPACAVEMHMDMRQETFNARIDKKNAAFQDHDALIVRARATEMHLDT